MPGGNSLGGDWEGEHCPTCGQEIFRLFGPKKQCFKCYQKTLNDKSVELEECECPKCKAPAVRVTSRGDGLQFEKIVCPECGTFKPT